MFNGSKHTWFIKKKFYRIICFTKTYTKKYGKLLTLALTVNSTHTSNYSHLGDTNKREQYIQLFK